MKGETTMKCPGQDSKYWKDDAIFDVACPECGSAVEFYKDDTSRKCPHCQHRFVNPRLDFGCASYCQFAEQCLGSLPEDFTGPKDDLLKDKIAVEIKRFYHTDFKAIRQASSAARHAEAIGKISGANLALILCSTFLHGIDTAHATRILVKTGANEEMIREIQNLLVEQTQAVSTLSRIESRIIHDATLITNIMDKMKSGLLDHESAGKVLDDGILEPASHEHIKTLFAHA